MQRLGGAQSTEALLLAAWLSFGAATANIGDTVARLLFSYVLFAPDPLPIEVKSVFAAFQLLCALWFLWAAGPLLRTMPSALRGRSWEAQPVLLGLVTVLFVFEVGGFGRYADPLGSVTGYFWAIGFLAVAYLVWDLRGSLRRRPQGLAWWGDLLLVALALIYVTGSLEFFYFWTQTLFDFSQPVEVVYVSLFAPHILGVLALGLLWWWARARAVRAGKRPLWRDLLVGSLLTLAILIPPVLAALGHGLPEIVIRAFVLFSLGFSGYAWPSASLFLAAIPLYADTVASLWPGRAAKPAQRLCWLGIASLPWNGITTLAFGYTSIPGSFVALDAVLLGKASEGTGQQTGCAPPKGGEHVPPEARPRAPLRILQDLPLK